MTTHSALRLISGALVAVSIAGCRDLTSPEKKQLSELEANRAKWMANMRTTYFYTLQQSCFCVITEPVRVYVRHDSVVAAVTVANQTPVNTQWVRTIESLFDFVARAIADHAVLLRVTYDPSLGYPTQIDYDLSKMIADDEVTYTLRDVTLTSLVPEITQGTAPAAPARRGSAPAVTLPRSIRTAAP